MRGDAARAHKHCVRAVRVTMTWVHIASTGSHPNVFAVHLFSSFTRDADMHVRHRNNSARQTAWGSAERQGQRECGEEPRKTVVKRKSIHIFDEA